MEKLVKKERQKKMEQEKGRSSKQISEKKQDIKYDTRDYVIDYLID